MISLHFSGVECRQKIVFLGEPLHLPRWGQCGDSPQGSLNSDESVAAEVLAGAEATT